jgi:hypothetical protein
MFDGGRPDRVNTKRWSRLGLQRLHGKTSGASLAGLRQGLFEYFTTMQNLLKSYPLLSIIQYHHRTRARS